MRKYQANLLLKDDTKAIGRLEGDFVECTDDIPKPSDMLPWIAALLSIVSIVFTAFQASETRRNNRIAVLPQLMITKFGIAKQSIGVLVENDGIGPAVIKSFDVSYHNKKLNSIGELRNKLISPLKITIPQLPYVEIEKGYFYRAGQTVNILSEGGGSNALSDVNREKIWKEISDNVDFSIEYCSVYDECRHACLHDTDTKCSPQQ